MVWIKKGKLGDGARLTGWSWVIATEAGAARLERLGRTRFFKNGVVSFASAQLPHNVFSRARFSLARSTAGPITSISSRPSAPFSPACGLRPATARRGRAMPPLDHGISARTLARTKTSDGYLYQRRARALHGCDCE